MVMSERTESRDRNRFFTRIIYIVSAIICGAVVFLMYGPRPEGLKGALDVSLLPTVNASLNGFSTLLLLTAFVFIKRGDVQNHKRAMLSAFATSAAFLVSYVLYHWFKEGPRPYLGAYRSLYYTILLSHVVLAASVLPLALLSLYRGWSMQVAQHKRIVRWAFPIWLYVSITGVTIYFMLY